jgi:hypothetical protein
VFIIETESILVPCSLKLDNITVYIPSLLWMEPCSAIPINDKLFETKFTLGRLSLLESVAELAIAQRTRPYSAIQFVAQLPVAELLHFWCVVFTVTGGGKDYPRPWIHKGLANNWNHPLQPGRS